MSVEAWVRRWWRGEAGVAGRLATLGAWPLGLAYRAGVGVRNRLFDLGVLRARRGALPVVSVGNVTVGGTGKTPMAAWLVRQLREAGCRPALVARGYGRDELLLHARWNPRAPVIAGPDRFAGVQRAARQGCDVVVLDDGFQHRRLARTADVVLVAAETMIPGRTLPVGPYREPLSALARADLVVVTRKSAPEARAVEVAERLCAARPELVVARVALSPAGWRDLEGAPATPPTGPVLVAAAVAEPESVRATVRAALAARVEPGQPVPLPELVGFPDHHEFTAADAERLARAAGGRTLVVTEKDAVKLVELEQRLACEVRVLALEPRFEEGQERMDALVDALVASCREAKA